jgi:hypothetical protein
LEDFERHRQLLQLAALKVGPDLLSMRRAGKSPDSIFIRHAMALDLAIWRLRARQKRSPAERYAELLGIRIAHRLWKDEVAGFQEALQRDYLEHADGAGGVQ